MTKRYNHIYLRCVGVCALAPVVMLGEKVFGRVSPEGVKEILELYKDAACACPNEA